MLGKNQFTKGIILKALGSFWWGFIGVIYFKYIAFAGKNDVFFVKAKIEKVSNGLISM